MPAMLSKLAMARRAPMLMFSMSMKRDYCRMLSRCLPLLQSSPTVKCISTTPTNCVVKKKNLYYNFAKEKNASPNSNGTKLYMVFLGLAMFSSFMVLPYFMEWLDMEVDARELESSDESKAKADSGETTDSSDGGEGELEAKKKKRVSFRQKKIIEYENRIRNYSTPDKIFRYFATLKVRKEEGGDEIYMTPEDFVRSLMPGTLQPEEYGLDKFKRFDPAVDSLDEGATMNLREGSIFYSLEKHGLISFSDYILLLTLLSTPPKQFELAFKMFDENGDGDLDPGEYEKVQAIIRARTSAGQRHRDHANTGNVIKTDHQGALGKYFFGEKLDQKLSYKKFLQFHRDIQDEILWIEFHHLAELEGPMDAISERDFANQILLYANVSDQKRVSTCRRVRREFTGENKKGINYKEYYDFAQVLKSINEIDTALAFYHVAGASIDKTTLKHVARTVAKVELTEHLVDVVFAIFDENDDEKLSNKEFVSVMKKRLMRGLETPRETPAWKLISAFSACASSQVSDAWDNVMGYATGS